VIEILDEGVFNADKESSWLISSNDSFLYVEAARLGAYFARKKSEKLDDNLTHRWLEPSKVLLLQINLLLQI